MATPAIVDLDAVISLPGTPENGGDRASSLKSQGSVLEKPGASFDSNLETPGASTFTKDSVFDDPLLSR